MPENKDIAVLAKKVYELSVLTPEQLEARKWEALLFVSAVYSAATPDGVAKAQADREARWGDAIRKEGLLSALHPKWHLRTDDGKPPVLKHALESALINPHRDLRTRFQALLFIPPGDREPLTDLVRALAADAFSGAKGEARDQYLDVMRGLSPTWFKDPWLTVQPQDGQSPLEILIDNQGSTHDGGIYDDPSDDTEWEKIKFGWADAIRTWDVNFLRDNPLAQLYLGVESAAAKAAETAGDIASGANEAAKGIATLLKWAPYAAAGIAVVGLTAAVLVTRR
jgi:hypothetical protein